MLRFFTVSRLALNTNLIFEIGSSKCLNEKSCSSKIRKSPDLIKLPKILNSFFNPILYFGILGIYFSVPFYKKISNKLLLFMIKLTFIGEKYD